MYRAIPPMLIALLFATPTFAQRRRAPRPRAKSAVQSPAPAPVPPAAEEIPTFEGVGSKTIVNSGTGLSATADACKLCILYDNPGSYLGAQSAGGIRMIGVIDTETVRGTSFSVLLLGDMTREFVPTSYQATSTLMFITLPSTANQIRARERLWRDHRALVSFYIAPGTSGEYVAFVDSVSWFDKSGRFVDSVTDPAMREFFRF